MSDVSLPSTRTYVVLAERTVESDVGDTSFVLLGFYESNTASRARRDAARDFECDPACIVAVPSRYWRAP